MTKAERSAEMSRIRRKGIKKPKRVARRSNEVLTQSVLNLVRAAIAKAKRP